jgi:hypothetical protein
MAKLLKESLNESSQSQSYEEWLDDVFFRIAVHYDWDVNEDYTRELFVKYEDELKEIYEEGGDMDDGADFVIENDESVK